jgi:hypothetical protein
MLKSKTQMLLSFVLVTVVSQVNAQWGQEEQKNWDAHIYNLERHYEKERDSTQSQGGGSGGTSVAPALLLAVIGGALLEWSRQPQAKRPVIDYVQLTKRHRENLVLSKCRSARQSTLVQPRYEKPNSWKIARIFQSDRAAEFKEANAKYQAALAESESACSCAAGRSVAEGGFSETEWRTVAAAPRSDRPWMALEEARVRQVLDACASHSPSDTQLSWLYAASAR